MKLIKINPRENFENIIQEQGFLYADHYYTEAWAYEFSSFDIHQIETATQHLFQHCVEATDYLLKNDKKLESFQIPKKFYEIIKKSWQEDDISFYGRFDLAYYHFSGKVKLMEFNADTPTSLLESSVIQWFWLEDFNQKNHTQFDQFNSIHDKLLNHIQSIEKYLQKDKFYLTCFTDAEEDFMNISYLAEVLNQAGVESKIIDIQDIGLNEKGEFVDGNSHSLIKQIFKLYPWEWLFREEFSDQLIQNYEKTFWIEPLYKSIWSNKAFMVLLWELFPDSPYLLKASFKASDFSENYVKKPLLSREGANVTIVKDGKILSQTNGDYGREGYIFQEYFEIPQHQGFTPMIGSWVIGGESAGIGIRQSENIITDNKSEFVNHYIK